MHRFILALLLLPGLGLASDPRFCGPLLRSSTGEIIRSPAVLLSFEKIHPRPKDGRRWYKDHVIQLSCGGCDSVQNLQWLPEDQWRAKSLWERKVYGGQGISLGCP